MSRVGIAALAALGVLVVAGAGAGAAPPTNPVLAITYVSGSGWSTLGPVDPVTLKPAGGAISVGNTSSWSFSPDRQQLALAGPGAVLRIVDTSPLQVRAEIRLPAGEQVGAVTWLRPDRVLVRVAAAERMHVVAVDPRAGRVLRVTALRRGYGAAFGRLADGLAFLVDSAGRFAPAQVAVVDADGRVRIAVVRRALIGSVVSRRSADPVLRLRSVGFAVDPDARRAYVVTRDFSVATVDLRTMKVGYHGVRIRTAASARRSDKWIVGSTRVAAWLGDGALAAAGWDYARQGNRARTVPLPIRLIDTRDWTARMLDARGLVQVAGGLLLNQGSDNVLRAFGADGQERYRVPLPAATWIVYGGRLAYACRNLELTAVLELASGTVLHEGAALTGSPCAQVLVDQTSRG